MTVAPYTPTAAELIGTVDLPDSGAGSIAEHNAPIEVALDGVLFNHAANKRVRQVSQVLMPISNGWAWNTAQWSIVNTTTATLGLAYLEFPSDIEGLTLQRARVQVEIGAAYGSGLPATFPEFRLYRIPRSATKIAEVGNDTPEAFAFVTIDGVDVATYTAVTEAVATPGSPVLIDLENWSYYVRIGGETGTNAADDSVHIKSITLEFV